VAPVIHEARALGDFFSGCDTQAVPRGFIFYEEGGLRLSEAVSSFIPSPSSFSVIIGPEGGFTKKEVDCAKEKGFVAVSLGKRILRAETASISAVALVQFLFGDMA
jgi:16S rRNA (uracil1498-N3)-methyltransferase